MNEPTNQTMDWSPGAREAQSRERFIGAWLQALGGAEPPEIDEILAAFGESASIDFRRDLESIDSLFRKRLTSGNGDSGFGGGAATVNFDRRADPTVNDAARAGTADTLNSDSAIQFDSANLIGEASGPAVAAAVSNDNSGKSNGNLGGAAHSEAAPPMSETVNLPSDDGPVDGVAATRALQAADLFAPGDPNAETAAYFGDDTPAVRKKRITPVPLPQAVAGYEILGVLGRGGMGVVYKARQPGLKRLVALKMILAGNHASSDDLARFRSEAEAVARLQHPNIVQIYEIGEDDGRPYFSLEFVDGQSLSSKLEGKPQSPRQAAEIIHVLAKAMAVAHAQGIVHRDLKPANILVAHDGTPKITDFGLAKRLEDEDGAQTRSGSILGTPDYMSPEQASGRIREVGPPADIYALGAMLYEMLAGRVPLRGASVLDTLQQVVSKEPVAPTQFDTKVPRDLETICLKCLRKDPAKRYARVDDLAEDLRRFLAGEPILARPVARGERAWRWCKRNPRVAALSGAVAALIVFWGASASAVAWKFKEKNILIASALDDAKKGWTEAENNLRVAEVNEAEAKHNAEDAKKGWAEAENNLRVAQLNEAEARHNAQVADEHAAQAETNADAAKEQHRKAVDLFVELGKHLEQRLQGRRSLLEKPELRGLQEELLGMVRSAMTDLAKEIESSNVTSFAMANTCFKLGELLFRFGHGEEALRQYAYGYKLVKQVVDDQPENDLARANLAVMLTQIGKMELELNDDARSARARFVEAHALQQAIADKPQNNSGHTQIDHHRLLSSYDIQTGIADLRLGQPAKARESFEAALAHREARCQAEDGNVEAKSYLSEAQYYLGVVSWHLNDLDATQDHFRKALTICHELAGQYDRDFSFLLDLAQIYGDYCDAKLRMGKPEDARRAVAKSLEFLQLVLDHDKESLSRQPLLAQTYERQALVAQRLGEADQAAKHFADARKLREDMLLVDPANQSWKMACALTLAHCGDHAAAALKAQEVLDKSPDNVGMLLQAARAWAVCASVAGEAAEKGAYRQRAIDALGKATRGEFRDPVLLETDAELSLLAEDPGYAAMLAEIKARN
ncbi:MAG TPA: serine/threonine-protein kinase [Pirellulales bacterium]|nr:serine/threonine-protein kinase [Pirellulales bacterium]